MRRVCAVVTARPSYSRIKTALRAIAAHSDLELQLVVAGSALLERYGSAVSYVEADGFEIAARVNMVVEGDNLAGMAKTTGLGLIELSTAFDNLRPDVVVTVADRYETMSTAVAAAYMNIPLAHVQGGEVTGSIDEKVRHAVTKLADLHLVSTQKAAERVVCMGEDPDSVFLTGCPSIDLALESVTTPADPAQILGMYGGVGEQLDLRDGYLVVLQHPVTTEYEASLAHVTETLEAVAATGLATAWFWPNVDAGSDGTSKGIRMFRENRKPNNIHFYKNMAPAHFIQLVKGSRALVGNSSVGIRECAFLGVPVVNIGTRQHGRERAPNVLDAEYDRRDIQRKIKLQLENGHYPSAPLYGDGKAGERIAQVLHSAELRFQKRLLY